MNQLHEISVDSAPDWGGDPAHTNPEQALASTLSSCQMSVTHVNLNPIVHFDTGFAAENEKLEKMQDRTHCYRFIANTLPDSVEINIH